MPSDCRARCSGLRSGWRTTASPRASFAGGPAVATSSSIRRGRANYNRVLLCGRADGMEAAGVARWIDLFKQHGVKNFFVWLSPGPDMETVRGWLQAHGLSRRPYVRYPTLLRDGNAPAPFKSDLAIR